MTPRDKIERMAAEEYPMPDRCCKPKRNRIFALRRNYVNWMLKKVMLDGMVL